MRLIRSFTWMVLPSIVAPIVYSSLALAQSDDVNSRAFTVWNQGEDVISRPFTVWNQGEDIVSRSFTVWNQGEDIISRSFTVWNQGQDVISRAFTVFNCNTGACCLGINGCLVKTSAECASIGGVFLGLCSRCPPQIIVTGYENGQVFTHPVSPPMDCSHPPRVAAPPCDGQTIFIDAWVSPPNSQMCQQFGVTGSPAIPAGFFGTGSDAFAGSICLEGVPLGPTSYGDFGQADTLVARTEDPIDRCALPQATRTINVDVVALSLASVSPITVYYGGQSPETWNVRVDLSPTVAPHGSLTATKSHCNGGTYTSILNVQARFTFTKTSNPATVRVLDTGSAGIPPVTLTQSDPQPWLSDLSEGLIVTGDPCTAFHPGISDLSPTTDCDCNHNGIRDKCEIGSGASADCDANGVPDECELAGRDCNGNGIPDKCEDCNHNTFADQCDIASGRSPDCNANGVPDECEVVYGTSMDCNSNGVPDECEYPVCPGFTPGDMNCDGVVNALDIRRFVASLTGGPYSCSADMNRNGSVEMSDVGPFVTVLLGQ